MFTFAFAVFGGFWLSAPGVSAQNPPTETAPFAPGTITVITPEPAAAETNIGPLVVEEFVNNPALTWGPPDFPDGKPFFETDSRELQEMARHVNFRREVYCLEFSFKPMRQMMASVPQPDGNVKEKLIWYLVFRLRYQGLDLRPAAEERELGGASYSRLYPKIEGIVRKQRYSFPMLALRSEKYEKEYLDRVIPAVTAEIASREKILSKLHNTVEITGVPIPYSKDPDAPGVWGVATWEDLDPRIDFFSVYVEGITNAVQRLEDGTMQKKALQLNFFRPGDTIRMLDDTIRYGIPAFKDAEEQTYVLKQYAIPERLDYRWIFR